MKTFERERFEDLFSSKIFFKFEIIKNIQIHYNGNRTKKFGSEIFYVFRFSFSVNTETLGCATYGEVNYSSMVNIMTRFQATKEDTFLDLGHGTGKLPMFYALSKPFLFHRLHVLNPLYG